MIYAISLLLATFMNEMGNIFIKQINEIKIEQKNLIILFLELVFAIFGFFTFEKNPHFIITPLSMTITIISTLGVFFFFQFFTKAVEEADRSTVAIFSTLVLPLLLITDIIFGYGVNIYQIIGIIIITITLIYLSLGKTLNLKGIKYVIISQLFAFVSIAGFKYLLTHYSSPLVQMLIGDTSLVLMFIAYITYKYSFKTVTDSFKFRYLTRFSLNGLSSIIVFYLYSFFPASILTALRRVLVVFWGVVMGKLVFNEDNFNHKITSFVVLSFGVLMLYFQNIYNFFSGIIF